MDKLRIEKDQIVDESGRPVRLRGWGVGGWMNSENFINGYPGCEETLRELCVRELGREKAEHLWNRMLDHFLAEDDIRLMRELGATVVRLPLNYRHFESDAKPFAYLEDGFRRLDRVLDWCREAGLYAILDMHAVAGWQDPDWHSDNPTRSTLLWRHPHFQDRFIALWEELARRYRDDPVVAGYDVMNEPVTGAPYGFHGFPITCDWAPLNALNQRVVEAIRKIDRAHIVFLEGDFFSTRFDGMAPPPDENIALTPHMYLRAGFGPGKYPGTFDGEPWDRAMMEKKFLAHEGTAYTRRHGIPLWVGEFGGLLNAPDGDLASRLRADDDQMSVFEQHGAHWAIWTWKDIGMMGAVTVDPDSAYMRRVAPVLEAKVAAATDAWIGNVPSTKIRDSVMALGETVLGEIPDVGLDRGLFQRYLVQTVCAHHMGTVLQPAWVKCFKDLSMEQIDEVMASFAVGRCRRNEKLLDVMRRHMKA
jgi:endoglucanase